MAMIMAIAIKQPQFVSPLLEGVGVRFVDAEADDGCGELEGIRP